MSKESFAIMIQNPMLLQLQDPVGATIYGCDQLWYHSYWQRLSGCGPSTATNLMLYFQNKGSIPTKIAVHDKKTFTALMELLWQFVTPRYQGVHLLSQFYQGVEGYMQSIKGSLDSSYLEIPKEKELRPSFDSIVEFIVEGLKNDSPIAFLNLSRGSLKNLDEWHWVTLVGIRYEENSGCYYATIYDASKKWDIDLGQWYDTTKRGGGFIAFKEPVQ
ncbi:hypothetical protein SpiGrapes_0844 [Sphaerochaeta pleomorpha str. Grapes]|uniref:Peptidase C39-like domain-containing protein n=1 Tax=Sphaerochaeta pleomorpha (strain ATCC BAA-1885 / DSM 22778 / Grapes) TaxID=158190 RepID=G8QQ94_SPHPG|nr:hypothetical protein [Sphaerochaeta pleomorpha]AEV28671.1 hypothetical protein SpiGrapes_0844 [Sphaerochaeta pleomorpha str. Grapes]